MLPRTTWIKLGRPELEKSDFYIKLTAQGLVEPLGIWRDVEMTIMGISMRIDFELIEPRSGSTSYHSLVG